MFACTRLLDGLFKQPSAGFNPEFELCAGVQFFENLTKSVEENRMNVQPRASKKDKIVKKKTKSGEVFYVKMTTDSLGNM